MFPAAFLRAVRWGCPAGPAGARLPLMSGRPGPHPHLRVRVDDSPARVEICLAGELDLATVPQLRQTIDAHARSGQTMVIDLRELDFVDSMGLAALVRARHRAIARGAKLQLVAPPESVFKVFALTHLDRIFDWVPQPPRTQSTASNGT
jgi:anti-sigma B factor antagonist